MATRKIVKIDDEKCTGCGECVPSCAEGAIQIINGKAKLVADNLCDGLGACLGDCPMDAITIEERDADEFNEEAVETHRRKQETPATPPIRADVKTEAHVHVHAGGGCPGARVMHFDSSSSASSDEPKGPQPSELRQWPVQLHLVPPTAPYFHKADVLLAADCVAFSMGDFHRTHLKGKALAIACPKLDDGQDMYLEKLTAMIDHAEINTLTVMIMEVPCCGGLFQLAKEAASRASRKIPIKRVVVGLRGEVLREEWA
jgi:NAD-dependent dihydropyrimidine dehydrogenase PreA subunit